MTRGAKWKKMQGRQPSRMSAVRGGLVLAALAMLAELPAAAATAAIEISTEAQFESLLSSDRHSLVEFYAPWCEACKAFSPLLETAVAELQRSHATLQHMRVDGDSQDNLRARFKVLEAPGLLLLPNGGKQLAADADVVRYDGALETAAVVAWATKELGRFAYPSPPRSTPQPSPPPSPPPSTPPPPPPPDRPPRPTPSTPVTAAPTTQPPAPAAPAALSKRGAAGLRKHAAALLATLRDSPAANARGRAAGAVVSTAESGGSHEGSHEDRREAIDAELLMLLERREALLQEAKAARTSGRDRASSSPPAAAAAKPAPSSTPPPSTPPHEVRPPPSTPPPEARPAVAAAARAMPRGAAVDAHGRASAIDDAAADAASADVQTLLFGDEHEVAAKHRELEGRPAQPAPAAKSPTRGGTPTATPTAKPAATPAARKTPPANTGASPDTLLAELDALLASDEYVPPDLSTLDELFDDDAPPSRARPSAAERDEDLEALLGSGPPPKRSKQKPTPQPDKPDKPTPSKPVASATRHGPSSATPGQQRQHGTATQPKQPKQPKQPSKPRSVEEELDELLGADDPANSDMDLEDLLRSDELFPNEPKPAASAGVQKPRADDAVGRAPREGKRASSTGRSAGGNGEQRQTSPTPKPSPSPRPSAKHSAKASEPPREAPAARPATASANRAKVKEQAAPRRASRNDDDDDDDWYTD